MKYLYLLLTVCIVSACSKEEGYGPFNLKEGQKVELLVGHRYGAVGDTPLLLPQNESPELPLSGFNDREAGYTYRLKATMVAYKGPQMMDGGSMHHLKFIEVISKEKHEGEESFELSLVRTIVPGPAFISLQKEDDSYLYLLDTGAKIQLHYTDEQVGEQLAEIWEYKQENVNDDSSPTEVKSKWKSIRVTVTHDRENFGKAYLVSHIEFKE